MTVWKYELKIINKQSLMMPVGASPLAVAEQHGKLMLWALVDEKNRRLDHTIIVIGTGHPWPDGSHRYVGAVPIGEFVWHVLWPTYNDLPRIPFEQ